MGAFQGNTKLLCEQAGALHVELYVCSQQYLFECGSSKIKMGNFISMGKVCMMNPYILLQLIEEEILSATKLIS